MKLFVCDGEFLISDVHLNIRLNVSALNEEEAKENFIKKANNQGFVWLSDTEIFIEEILEVDGYKVILVPKEDNN